MNVKDYVVLQQGGLQEARAVRDSLEAAGVNVQIIPEQGCTTNSCAPKFMIAVHKNQVEEAQKALVVSWAESASADEIRAAAHVINHNDEEITCPACMSASPSGSQNCTDCGLRLG